MISVPKYDMLLASRKHGKETYALAFIVSFLAVGQAITIAAAGASNQSTAWGLKNAVPREEELSCAILAGPSSRLLRLETWLHPGARMWWLASAGYWITALSVAEKIVVLPARGA
ncbi:hypothetical protein NUU61_002352 [Penicillium alfredii]|uniref:Uncharacterized protein n=1 Tax=Penicillium alfredii TaxID=1506179 RepID=A0A9W9FS44_9EURO|nr:uncharacterized protein NUU61_002352 [Penicillium alfredii]KAJ5105005.1 hypothetical protein NUU61_002352 [Penicillium alfredii]